MATGAGISYFNVKGYFEFKARMEKRMELREDHVLVAYY
jgi:hypothetical protein